MKRIAIIPARGGSKRIPGKNLKLFCGYPIIEYSIKTALDSGLFDLVFVSTDNEEIKRISIEAGASVPFMRSSVNSSDTATTAEVLKEVLLKLEAHGNKFIQGCCIYPTAPFITIEKLVQSVTILSEKHCDSVIPVVKYSYPIQRSLKIEGEYVKFIDNTYSDCRSQDMEDRYHDCGQFYTFDVKRFLENEALITENTIPIILEELEVQDIDTYSDWRIAELKYEIIKGMEKSKC